MRAVATLLNRHDRDAEAIAARHGAQRVFPRIMASRGAPIALPDVQERTLWKRLRWYEAALWLPDRQLLIAPEALGTAGYYCAGDERLAVHPLLRPWPPRLSLAGLHPTVISVGHGRPLTEGADAALQDALRTARRRLPKAWVHAFRTMRARAARRGSPADRSCTWHRLPLGMRPAVSRCGSSSRRRSCRPRAASPGTRPTAAARCGRGCRR